MPLRASITASNETRTPSETLRIVGLIENVYCQRGQMENLIKLHKAQLASDRMSRHSATANQVRFVLHTAAFWLMWRACSDSEDQPTRQLRVRDHSPCVKSRSDHCSTHSAMDTRQSVRHRSWDCPCGFYAALLSGFF